MLVPLRVGKSLRPPRVSVRLMTVKIECLADSNQLSRKNGGDLLIYDERYWGGGVSLF